MEMTQDAFKFTPATTPTRTGTHIVTIEDHYGYFDYDYSGPQGRRIVCTDDPSFENLETIVRGELRNPNFECGTETVRNEPGNGFRTLLVFTGDETGNTFVEATVKI